MRGSFLLRASGLLGCISWGGAQQPMTCLGVFPKGPSTQIVGFQGPKTLPSMDFGT